MKNDIEFAIAKEIPIHVIQENINDVEIKKLKIFDFHGLDKLLRKYSFETKCEGCEEKYIDYKNKMIEKVKNGLCDPIFVTKKNKKVEIVDGKLRLAIHKVLGIEPLIKYL